MIIKSSGTFTVQPTNSTNDSWNGDLSVPNVTTSGSNATATVQNIASGSWQGLDTSSLSDLRYAHFDNIGTGLVKIANDNAGAQIKAILFPNDVTLISWSGSATLYANVFSGSAGTQLKYILSES